MCLMVHSEVIWNSIYLVVYNGKKSFFIRFFFIDVQMLHGRGGKVRSEIRPLCFYSLF